MIGRKLILMLIVLITMTVSLSAGITRKDAENIVLLQILSNDIGKVDVYSLSTLLNSGDKILISDRQLNCPYFQNWVFLVDDFVRASWAHPCRYIFVNEANGNYQIINETMPPFDMSYYEIISEMQFNLENYLVTDPNATIENSREPNDHLYAVLINGGICSTFNDVRFWNDLSAIYCTLTQVYGYKHENIYVHSTDGLIDNNYGRLDLDQVLPYTNDIDHGAFKDDIEDTFDTLANEMDSHDQLFVYVTDHGDTQNRIQLWGNDTINTLELNTMLNSIESSEIVVVMGQCYSGGFISNPVNVTGSHRTIFTSTNASEGSYLELWITGGNYDEFVFYWTTAARGYFPGLRPWELSEYEVDEFPFNNYFNYGPTHPAAYDPDLNGDGFIQMEEAFDYANNFDTWSPEGYYNTSYPVGHPGHIYAGCDEHPCSSQNIGFQEDLLCLTGITGIIENSQNVSGKFLLSEIGIQIEDGVSLSISNGSSFYLSNQSKIIADELSSLNIGNLVNFYGENATLIADPPLIPETIPGNKIEINGNLIIGSEINLNIENDNYWDGMYIYDCPYMITMNYPTINNCNLYSEGTMMTINDGSLTNCEISHYGQDLEIYDSQLTNSIIYANEPDPLEQSSFVFNNGSIVNSDNAKTAITISSYYDFQINENYINSLGSAIYLYESGYGQENQIKNNELNGTGTYFGVRLYHSYAQIEGHNTITNKQIGVVGLNNCQISMNGSNYSPYQIIHNNNFDELVFTHDSFPYSFHYNQIFDDADHSYYLLKCADHGYSRAHNV